MTSFVFNNQTFIFGSMMTLLGASLGSFAALIIKRLPRGESIVPRSHCDICEHKLYAWHNIPILSWLILRGRCFFCRAFIGLRPLIIEIILASCLLGLYVKFGFSFSMVEHFLFVFLLLCLAYIDLDTFLLPLNLLLCLIMLGVISNVIYSFYPALYFPITKQQGLFSFMVLSHDNFYKLSDRVLGSLLGSSLLVLVNIVATFVLRRTGRLSKTQWAMGAGDPLLVLAIGLFVGLSHLVLVLFLASMSGAIMGLLARFSNIKTDNTEEIVDGALPYGPFLALAAIYVYVC